MERMWLGLLLWVALHVLVVVNGMRKRERAPEGVLRFYGKELLTELLILGVFALMVPEVLAALDFAGMDRGILIREDILVGLMTVFGLPLVMSLTPWDSGYPRGEAAGAKEIFGFPTRYFPGGIKEFMVFGLFIITGVIFEELVSRHFAFHLLSGVLGVEGDWLVMLTAVMFALGHVYQGFGAVLTHFVLGMILGKVYMHFGDLRYPVVLHLLLNLTILVYALRRMHELRE